MQKYGCIGYEGQMNEGQVFFIATHATMKMCKIKESTKISMWKLRADAQAQELVHIRCLTNAHSRPQSLSFCFGHLGLKRGSVTNQGEWLLGRE